MRRIIRLFNKSQLFSLTLIQPSLDTIRLLQLLQSQRQQLGIVFIIERREWDGLKSTCFKPMYRHSINRNALFTRHVRTVFEIIMLTFLFRFKPNSRKSTEILFRNSFIDGSATTNTFTVEVACTDPPIGFGFDVSKDDGLDRCGKTGDRPR